MPKKVKNKGCYKCSLLNELFERTPKSDRDYWLMTELFILLHGKDFCEDARKKIKNKLKKAVKL